MDIKLLVARINDLKQISQKSNSPKFIGFLNAEETTAAAKQFNQAEKYAFFGGYDNAERVMLGVLPEWCDDPAFPITAVTFTFRPCDKLSHRDFLGALMALGIARETVGDILIKDGKAVVFVSSDISKFVLTQIDKVGNVGVTLSEGCDSPLPEMGKKLECSVTVASVRLDCVVAAICNMSRTQASEKIADGLVMINSVCVTKPTLSIRAYDKITIRQKGKYDIVSCDEVSKKGRIILKYNKYV